MLTAFLRALHCGRTLCTKCGLLIILLGIALSVSAQGNIDYANQIAIEDSLVREEMRFNRDGMFMPLRGIIQTFTHRDFNQMPGPYVKRDNHWGDWGVALSPLAATWALKAFGVKSRSNTRRMVTANGLALGLTVGLSQTLRWSVNEARPDGSDNNSLPSMHAAVAFMGATVLSREYGHISPWITIGGYAAATGTQFLRAGHHAHWMNDIFLGAGIGVVSTNLAYYLTDKLIGPKGVRRMPVSASELAQLNAAKYRPSGFRLISGTETFGRTLAAADFAQAAEDFDLKDVELHTSASITTGVETEWYLTDYVSVGAIARYTMSQAKLSIPDNAVTAWGELLHAYHGDVTLGLSTLTIKDIRIGTRVIGGVRYNEGTTFREVAPSHQLGKPLLSIDSQVKGEMGIGIVIDMLQKHNQTVGISMDYMHTFGTSFLPDRMVIGSTWKAMF